MSDYQDFENDVRKTLEAWLRRTFPGAEVQVYGSKKYTGLYGVEHEIDVSATVCLDITIKVFVECKCYKRRVEKSEVLSFVQRVQDLGGTLGFMFTTVGYQEGAQKVAKGAGIKLVVLSPDEVTLGWEVIVPSAAAVLLAALKRGATDEGSVWKRVLFGSPDPGELTDAVLAVYGERLQWVQKNSPEELFKGAFYFVVEAHAACIAADSVNFCDLLARFISFSLMSQIKCVRPNELSISKLILDGAGFEVDRDLPDEFLEEMFYQRARQLEPFYPLRKMFLTCWSCKRFGSHRPQ